MSLTDGTGTGDAVRQGQRLFNASGGRPKKIENNINSGIGKDPGQIIQKNEVVNAQRDAQASWQLDDQSNSVRYRNRICILGCGQFPLPRGIQSRQRER